MKVLFATSNPAKVRNYKEELLKYGIELLTLKDIDIHIHVEENGKNAIENAYIKAKAYYDELRIPTIGMDNNLFIESIPDELQPGVFVRRINGKELNDDEMIKYYSNLVKEYGLTHISTGDIFRKALKEQTKYGVIAKYFMQFGHLVPDDYTIQMVREYLQENESRLKQVKLCYRIFGKTGIPFLGDD